ncbi:MAG: 23S rRNA (pseudouridine(1915)-N(3))-methyltransferase RlmH [Candidatus Saccharimonadota bacterium]
MPLTIIAIGKKHESWIAEGLARYEKRLKAPFLVNWVLLPHSSLEGVSARQEESERIQKRLEDFDYVVILDERGRELNSPTLAATLTNELDRSKRVALVIGGAYGVTDELRNNSQLVLSLSPLVFPHQLVRLILVEQLYRAQEITQGGKYHHK